MCCLDVRIQLDPLLWKGEKIPDMKVSVSQECVLHVHLQRGKRDV